MFFCWKGGGCGRLLTFWAVRVVAYSSWALIRRWAVNLINKVCGLSLLLVLVLAPKGLSLGTPVFPCTQKSTFLNFNSIRKVPPVSALR